MGVPDGGGADAAFVVPNPSSQSDFTTTKYSAGGVIDDNSSFTLTATVAMETAYGGTFGNLQGINSPNNAVSYTNMAGETVKPNVGIKSSQINANADVSDIFTVTAKEAITLRLYVVFADDSFTGNRIGDVYYSVNGGVETTKSLSARKTVWTIEATLAAGDVLTVGAKDTDGKNSRLWLFGAEAKKS